MLTEQDLDYYMSPPQWPCLLSVYGGHSVVVCSLLVCVYYVVHCLVVVTLLLFTQCGCVFIMWYIVLYGGSCPVALCAVSLWWSLCCCLFIVGVCLLCGTLSCGVVLVCCQFMVATLLLFVHCGCVFIMWYIVLWYGSCLLSVYGGHSVVVCSLWVCVYYVVHCLVVWFMPSGLVCCQFMVVTLLLFVHCGCVFIMWYIVLWCGSCPVALSAVSLWWSLCSCLLIEGVFLLCGTLSCGVGYAQWPCLLSVYGGHSVVVYSLWVGVYYVVHCLVVWFIPSGLVCCQFTVVTLLLFTHCGCVFIMWYIVLWCGSCPVALSAVSLRWSLCCCLFIVGVCLLCGTLSCGVVFAQLPCLLSVYVGHSVVVYSLWVCVSYVVHCLVVWFLPSGLVCCQVMVVTLLLFIHCGYVFIMWYIVLWWSLCCCLFIVGVCLLCGTLSCGVVLAKWPCLLSVYGGHSVVVYSLWVCVYYVVHCLVVWGMPSGLVCCQYTVVTLLLFTHCGCVFIMWYIVLWCGSCPVALSAVSLWWSLCCCLLIVGVCLLCGTLSCGVVHTQWPCLLSVYGGHSVVVYSLWVCVYYVVHCLVVWFLPSGLVCCQYTVVTLLLFIHCGCVFIMWYIALSAVSLWWSLCCCLFIVGVCLLCGTLS